MPPNHFALQSRIFIPHHPFYALTLICGVWQMCVAPIIASNTCKSPYLPTISTVVGLYGAFSWCWMAILLGFGSDNTSNHILSRCYTHLISLVFMICSWLGFGLFLVADSNIECRYQTSACQATMFSTALAFLISSFAFMSIATIYRYTVVSGVAFSMSVEVAREGAENQVVDRNEYGTGLNPQQDIPLHQPSL